MSSKKLLAVLLVAVAIAAAGLALSQQTPARPSQDVYVVGRASSCGNKSGTLACTITLASDKGRLPVSEVSGVLINGTRAQSSSIQNGTMVVVTAQVPNTTYARGLADVGPSTKPASVGQVEVELSDGTSASATLGPVGPVGPVQ